MKKDLAIRNSTAEFLIFTAQSGEESIDNLKFTHLAVRKTPRSGTSAELLRFEEIDAEAIVKIFNEGYSSRI